MATLNNIGNITWSGRNIAWVVGVTDDSANTALSTTPTNPFGHSRCVALAFGEGVYVEDDGSSRPWQSGVTADNIDVRASGTSAAFICLVIQCGGGESDTRDHSDTTT